jgi:hypothetical protein
MNEINSSQRIKEASYQRAEGEKLLKVHTNPDIHNNSRSPRTARPGTLLIILAGVFMGRRAA